MNMTDANRGPLVDRLLERLAQSFRLGTRIAGRTLPEIIAAAVHSADDTATPDWGGDTSAPALEKICTGPLTFFYRPHLFPGMDEDLRLGHLIQYRLLPRRLPPQAPVEAAALLESYCHLSGDVFGWRAEPDGSLTAWLLDVSGHGLRAGFAALVLTMLLEDSPAGRQLDELVSGLEERFLAAREPGDRACLYATGVLLRVDPGGGCSTVCAGHPPPLVRRAAGPVEELEGASLPIALVPGQRPQVSRTRLGSGDLVLIFSDGLVEAADAHGRHFGARRAATVLAEGSDRPAEVAERLYAEVAAHHDLSRLDDDLSFLVLRRPPG